MTDAPETTRQPEGDDADRFPKTADLALIQQAIPHRYPFLLIDKVRDIVPHKGAVGIKNITFNEPQFQGHFPSTPIFPGVMIIEAMAQTAATLVSISLEIIGRETLVYFMGIESAKFRRKVVPGDVLELHMTALRGGGKVWKFHGRALVEGELAAEAVITAMLDLRG